MILTARHEQLHLILVQCIP